MPTQALEAPEVAVELQDIAAAGQGVQVVDVLGDDDHLAQGLLQLSDGIVTGIGLTGLYQLEPVLVPVPDQLGMREEAIQGGQAHGIVPGPQSFLSLTKGWDAALLADPRAGEHHHAAAAGKDGGGLVDEVVHGGWEWANQRISESANQQINKSANRQINKSANG
jgi:hypothetical protein